jgi:hypothetical protein
MKETLSIITFIYIIYFCINSHTQGLYKKYHFKPPDKRVVVGYIRKSPGQGGKGNKTSSFGRNNRRIKGSSGAQRIFGSYSCRSDEL